MAKRLFPALAVALLTLLLFGCARGVERVPAGSQGAGNQLRVHFIDVGQADSILVQLPGGQNLLVDAGNNGDGQLVTDYLRKCGVRRIDFLVGTHPHEDHIGGLDAVIGSFDTGKVYMPRVTYNTRTFEDVLRAVEARGLKITPARAGVEIPCEGGASALMLAPMGEKYDSLNNYSPVIRVTYGQVSFLLAGDAESQSEAEMIRGGANLRADVLKVGHHGSKTSTSAAFLKAVSPGYAVISLGAGNDYGYPHSETLQKLKNVKVYRTDKNGTVVFSTDGAEIKVSAEKGDQGRQY